MSLASIANTHHRRADALRNERAILLAAARVLADDPAASMQAIADAAGVSRPTVYRSFPNREALIEAIVGAVVADCVALIDDAARAELPGADALDALVRELGVVVERYPLILHLMRMGPKAGAEHHRPPDPKLAAAFEELIRRGQDDGSIRCDVSVPVLRAMVFGGLVGALRSAEPADPRGIAGMVADVLVTGVRPRSQ